MDRFRKKPVVVEAVQLTVHNVYFGRFKKLPVELHFAEDGKTVAFAEIKTLEGTMRANLGDWIIKGVKGEFYPCKPDIFAATYDRLLN